MSTTTSSTRSPGSWDNLHHFQHPRTSTTTPAARPPKEPGSVGQSLPPLSFNAPLSPHKHRFPPPSQHTRTPSPNYFGLQLESSEDVTSAQRGRANWSSPSSNVRSAAATSPALVPLDQNSDFEAFRKRSEASNFSLGHPSDASKSLSRPDNLVAENQRRLSQDQNNSSSHNSHVTQVKTQSKDIPMENGSASVDPPSRSPKRLLSSDSANLTGRPRRNSPASFNDAERESRSGAATISAVHDSRFSAPPKELASGIALSNHRSETLPLSLDDHGPSMITPQHMMNILGSAHEEVLLLDLRVSTQYARSRISGALSLCIPTTLLKRSSFNVQKLAETFKDEADRQKFERWRTSKEIIVYDAASTTFKDATTCVNTLKKFANDGWHGASYILKGGFDDFCKLFPSMVHVPGKGTSAGSAKDLKLDARPEIAPVIGGCPMPATKSAANPFFGNIRQNMDLIGGVGQMPIHHPRSMTRQSFSELPLWLQQASDENNKGKAVSDKFLHIEKREQKRMQEALSGNVTYGTPGGKDNPKVQIAGIEKGSKNRYNNIWPFEHSRVRLQGVPDGGCDYINANHVQSEWSNKRYIATQGPIPATFSVRICSQLSAPPLEIPANLVIRTFGESFGTKTFASSSCSPPKKKTAKSKPIATGKTSNMALLPSTFSPKRKPRSNPPASTAAKSPPKPPHPPLQPTPPPHLPADAPPTPKTPSSRPTPPPPAPPTMNPSSSSAASPSPTPTGPLNACAKSPNSNTRHGPTSAHPHTQPISSASSSSATTSCAPATAASGSGRCWCTAARAVGARGRSARWTRWWRCCGGRGGGGRVRDRSGWGWRGRRRRWMLMERMLVRRGCRGRCRRSMIASLGIAVRRWISCSWA